MRLFAFPFLFEMVYLERRNWLLFQLFTTFCQIATRLGYMLKLETVCILALWLIQEAFSS